MTTVTRPAPAWTTAVRLLAVVAFLLIGHDVVMVNPAAAHGHQFEGHSATEPMSSMSLPTGGSEHLGPAFAGDSSGSIEDPAHAPDNGDCGVLRQVALPAVQVPAPPGVSDFPIIAVPHTASLSTAAREVHPIARAPTLDPQRRRALLQIYRM